MLTFHAYLLSALSALLLILLLSWLHKRGSISKGLAALLAFVALFIGNGYYYGVVAPQHQREARLNAAQSRLATMPVYRTLRTQQPALYQTLNAEFIRAFEAGETEKQALARLRPMLADLLNQRIPYASPAQLHAYMAVSLEEMKAIRAKSPDLCFRFLFPQVEGGVNIDELIPAALLDREMAVMDSFLVNSRGALQPTDVASGRAALQKIVRKLYETWGSDLQTLNSPTEKGADKSKLCDMTIDLYEAVLALPVNQSGEVLRIILDGTASG